jgi:Leucine-rich repeat (LRR) protein
LNLNNIGITGEIPPEIGNLTNLTELWLSGNELTGSIPPEIGNLTNLIYLYLYDNQLTGSIPPEIGNLTNLTRLWSHDNQLTGEIPETICDLSVSWSSSIFFRVYNNQLCPPYPSCVEDYVGEQDTSDCD